MEDNKVNNGVYQHDEREILDKIKFIRVGIMDALTKDGVPTNSRDIRILNEVMSAAESSVHTEVANRIKYTDAQTASQTKELIADVFKEVALAQKAAAANRKNEQIVSNDTLKEDDVVPGEMEINPGSLDVRDFFNNESE